MNKTIHVHIDAFAACNGISRFVEHDNDDLWKYSKDEGVVDLKRFQFLVTEKQDVEGFRKVGVGKGWGGLNWRRGFVGGLLVDKVFVLERVDAVMAGDLKKGDVNGEIYSVRF